MAEVQSDSAGGKTASVDARTRLAFIVTIFSISVVGVVALAIVAGEAFDADASLQGTQLVLTGILPLLGTWIGTILAYYFSKENFEAAAESERKRLEIMQDGAPVSALAASRKLGQTIIARMPESSVVLAPEKELFTEKKVERLPVLDDQNRPQYLLHKSSVNDFRATAGLTAEEQQKLTLETLGQKKPELLKMFKEGFATVGPQATILDAQRALQSKPKCADVFVTQDGTPNSPVLGWLTDTRIADNLSQ